MINGTFENLRYIATKAFFKQKSELHGLSQRKN